MSKMRIVGSRPTAGEAATLADGRWSSAHPGAAAAPTVASPTPPEATIREGRVDTYRETITIGRPREEVADELRRIEDHPRLFADADEVHLVGEDTYRWVVRVGPLEREVDVTFTHRDDHLLRWEAAGEGLREVGELRLVGDGPGRTELQLTAAYELDGALLQAADAVGLLERRVRRNLEGFRDHLEAREHLDDGLDEAGRPALWEEPGQPDGIAGRDDG
jgi:uncharacterized membrane protein